MMPDDDQQCDSALHGKEERRPRAGNQKPGKDRKAGGATMEAIETIRVMAKITAKTPKAASAAQGAQARKTPNPVATPLPPRKRSQQVNMCPRTAKSAAIACALRSGHGGHQKRAEQTAEPDRGDALEHVEKKRGRAKAFAADTHRHSSRRCCRCPRSGCPGGGRCGPADIP